MICIQDLKAEVRIHFSLLCSTERTHIALCDLQLAAVDIVVGKLSFVLRIFGH